MRLWGCVLAAVVVGGVATGEQLPAEAPPERAADPAAALDLKEDARQLARRLLGFHPCGDHWNSYGNFCEFYLDGSELKVRTHGDWALIEGDVVPLDATSFEIHGVVRQRLAPWADDADFPDDCGLDGTYLFRRTGKRKYFRHVKTCEVTFYFDVFDKRVTRTQAEERIVKRRAHRKKKGLP